MQKVKGRVEVHKTGTYGLRWLLGCLSNWILEVSRREREAGPTRRNAPHEKSTHTRAVHVHFSTFPFLFDGCGAEESNKNEKGTTNASVGKRQRIKVRPLLSPEVLLFLKTFYRGRVVAPE